MEMIARMQSVQYGDGFFNRLDPRVKIAVVLLFSVIGPLIDDPASLAILSMVTCGYLLVAGLKKTLLYVAGFYTLSMVLYLFIEAVILQRPPRYMEYLTLTLTMLPIMSGGLLLGMTTSLEKLIAGLARLGVPPGMRYTIMVAMRYVAMLGRELHHLASAMRVRGVMPGWKNFILQPLSSMRLILVPMLIRSFRVADRMGAAAELRGLSAPNNRIVLVPLRLGSEDCIFLTGNLLLILVLWAI
jgi:energy-coupling factor transport system permease protein